LIGALPSVQNHLADLDVDRGHNTMIIYQSAVGLFGLQAPPTISFGPVAITSGNIQVH
jgi:hypothetical protein